MTFEVFYTIEGEQDSIIIKGETIEEVREKTYSELDKRNAIYHFSNWLNN